MKRFLKDNILIFTYFAMACLIELIGVFVTSGKFYIKSPWVFLLVQLIFVCVLFCINTNKVRHIVASCFLAVFMIVNIVFVVLFEMTETMFDYGMLNLKNDAMAILESIPINFVFFTCSGLMIALFIVFGSRYARHNNSKFTYKFLKIIAPICFAILIALNSTVLYFSNVNNKKDIYEKLYKSNDASYAQKGITANFLSEMFKGTFLSGVKLGDENELENYIYSEVYNSNFSTNKTKLNLVTMLVESFEWTSFIQDFNLFVNGYKLINPSTNEPYQEKEANEILSLLYPNIYDYYKSSIALTNFYSREKTDIAENLSIIGSYPTDAYINYDFPENTISSSLANVMKNLYGNDFACNAFHNGTVTFYNRSVEMLSVGFDKFYGDKDMYEMGMPNHFENGERNLDSDMIKTCADLMFPTDKNFYTHITTITMHGQYTYRENLKEQGYYDEMAKYGIKAKDENENDSFGYNNFFYYCACVKEFDTALGETMKQLDDRGLKDNTVILLFGDHNTYYSSLSNYVKDISDTDANNYTNLFRVPCMIYYPKMTEIFDYVEKNKSEKLGTRYVINEYKNSKNENVKNLQVKKFTCTADIVPTLMDLLGINYFENLYFGHSIFDDRESVLYSRAYNMFITDSLYFSSLNNIKYVREKYEEKDPANRYADLTNYKKSLHLELVEKEAKVLLKKLDACNRIFYNDYFSRINLNISNKTNYQLFVEKLNNIN
ncbi:MAG: sulfatase-like hydrolase/transferase [Clostridia bacterium]|nr:sulfatase-like hydrolase/transferase [Clostridia bacterium]